MVSARQGHTPELRRILFSQLSNIKPASRLDDEVIESLLLTCGDSMLLAALDLIDAQEVSRIRLKSGRSLYQCSGTQTTYSITLEPLFCPCPAFIQQVLYLNSHLVCKHLLAGLIAQRLDRFNERTASLELLAMLSGGTAPAPANANGAQ